MNWRDCLRLAPVMAALALGACANPETEPVPLNPTEKGLFSTPKSELQREVDVKSDSQLGHTQDKATLFLSLDRNLRTWNDAVASSRGEDFQLTGKFESILARQVHLNFETILSELQTGEERNRIIAAAALGFTPTEPLKDQTQPESKLAIPALLKVLDEGNDQITQNAIMSLAKIADPETPRDPIFDLLLRHHNPEVRANAALAAARLITPSEAPRWLADLTAALDDDEPKVRLHVTTALGRTRHPDAVSPLVHALNDRYRLVQEAAAVSIGNLNDPSLCHYLVEKLEGGSSGLRKVAHDALCHLAGKDYGQTAEEWRPWCDGQKKQ